MKNKNNILVIFSISLIKDLHQKIISPKLNKLGQKCRFYPTCSNYGLIALKKYGFIKGWLKTIKRILRCNPKNNKSCVDYP